MSADKAAMINKIFSTLQLYSGLLSVVIILPVSKAIDKLNLSNN